ncbi:type II toxin-antitoxin system RelE/ParE family toxin [Caballeronia sp. LZ065]|uniref:type II toxin-antitoxin system RelE/ParE family toxin n=1 Tax=Caballeronia sp. LZ065 TaxID=3038571 RepID=UPI002864FAE1|nr:type II toxin-antitoxin system RelE/ParE family toxin [Caballeronia sp. LZ065]MDR5784589.1 type II toxin-antitoxin system RelE/ParE family toxin [Caballeronia sp. LZ065]
MAITVLFTSKSASDLLTIYQFEKKINGAKKAREIVKALNAEARSLSANLRHRIGEELDGWEGPPAREVHKDICLQGDYEIHYEIMPAYEPVPTSIVILRVWDTRQER